jgi:threonine/homoserine/homoserine lactone efflux protein
MGITDPLLFTVSVVIILLTPGPTNTLLSASSAMCGIRRSLPLLVAELAGYLSSLSAAWLLTGGGFLTQNASPILRIICGGYLLFLALRTLRLRDDSVPSISFRQVFTTTLLNPKGFVLALVILPMKSPNLALYVLGFSIILPIVGGAWIVMGSVAGRITQRTGRAMIPKIAAFALACFSAGLIVSTLIS